MVPHCFTGPFFISSNAGQNKDDSRFSRWMGCSIVRTSTFRRVINTHTPASRGIRAQQWKTSPRVTVYGDATVSHVRTSSAIMTRASPESHDRKWLRDCIIIPDKIRTRSLSRAMEEPSTTELARSWCARSYVPRGRIMKGRRCLRLAFDPCTRLQEVETFCRLAYDVLHTSARRGRGRTPTSLSPFFVHFM